MHFSNQILEFDKVKALIVDKAHTVLGKKLSMEITPTNNRLEIERKLKETSHALDILNGFQEPPFGGIRNLKVRANCIAIHCITNTKTLP